MKKELQVRETYICPLIQVTRIDTELYLMSTSKAEGDHNSAEDEDWDETQGVIFN